MNSGSGYAQIPATAEEDQTMAKRAYSTDACMICEYTGVAETEEYALQVLAGKEAFTSQANGAANNVPFVLQAPGSSFADKTDDHYNYAPVTIL